jgi:hypothetical protein
MVIVVMMLRRPMVIVMVMLRRPHLLLLVRIPGCLLTSAAVTLGRVTLKIIKTANVGCHQINGTQKETRENKHTFIPKSIHLRKFLHPLHHLMFIPLGLTTHIATSQLLHTPLFCFGMENSDSSHMTQFP